MSFLIIPKLWFEVDTETFPQPCGYLTNGEMPKNIPMFSKESAIRVCHHMMESIGMTAEEVKFVIDSIMASPLVDGFCEMDRISNELVALHGSGRAPDVDELGMTEALKRRIASKPKIDESQRLTTGEVGNGKAVEPTEDIELILDTGSVVHGVLKCGNVMTQPFFSKHCARNCVEGITKRFQFDPEVVEKTYATVEALDVIPEEPTGYDYAAARFMRLCMETRRSKKAFDHIYKLIELGIFLDLFGDDGDPP